MKRIVSLLLCLTLGAALAVPALAEGMPEPVGEATVAPETPAPTPEQAQTMDSALAALTLQVKQTLGVDDGYTDFSSDYYDGPSPSWSLYWSDDERGLSAQVRPDGTVVSMYRWDDSGRGERFYGFDPAFPALTPDEAETAAEKWCQRLFTGEESGRVDETHITLGSDACYRIGGTVLKNALESPITFSMVIDGTGLTSFYRSDSDGYVDQTPAAKAAVGAEIAAEGLAGAVELELRWVSDGSGGAKLLYMPVGARTVVDAQSGEAVDMDALYASLDGNGWYADNGTRDASAMAAATEPLMAEGGVTLTDTELGSIGQYGDVLDGEAIDEALRSVELLGLEGFEMARCSYSMDSETGDVTASVRYTGQMTADQLYGYSADAFDEAVENGQDMTIYKYITLNAKTGAIASVSTSYPLWEKEEGMLGLVDQAGFAEDFLALAVPELASRVKLCTLKGYDEDDRMTFAQVQDGYFFPDNRITVHVVPTCGVVDEFRYTWDEDVSFAPAAEVVCPEQALAAYTDALDVTLGYVAWPIDVLKSDDAVYADYARWGYTYVERLCLAYYYGGTDGVQGVDAVSGQAVPVEQRDDVYTYDDLADEPKAAQIETLGLAGVGFSGGRFLPWADLTVRDAAMLLLRADGMYAPEDDDERLLEQAASEGFLTRKGWQPEASVGRMEFLRMLLTPSRYGCAAQLAGIWDAGFVDVDEADEAYAALARALGLVDGTRLEPDENITRADAAAMLYRFMQR